MLVFCANINFVHAKNYNNKKSANENDNPRYASLVMDADTGRILSQRYADKTLHPASLTKMMTMLLTFEALDRGDIKKNTQIRISPRAASMVPSKLDLPKGSTIKIEDAIYALATKSANDIAVALAEHLGGSESRFANAMTARAQSIGMNKTRFKNASGLHDPSQITSARDMAKLAQYILKRYPHYYKYFSTRQFTYRGKTYRNHNRLLDTYRGMDGFKTGYVNASGFNLVASAHRDGHRLIGVVFGGKSGASRNDHMATIMDAGFRKVRNTRTAAAEYTPPPIPDTKPTYGVATAQPAQVIAKIEPTTNQAPQEAYASLSSLQAKPSTTIKTNIKNKENYTELSTALNNGSFDQIIGEGDFDPSVSKRIETGLIAVAVHKGDYKPNPAPASAVQQSLRAAGNAMVDKMGQQNNDIVDNGQTINAARAVDNNGAESIPHPKDVVGKWSIQIGAFNSRLKTDDALREAKKKLPAKLSNVSAMTVPLNTEKGMIFRARLGGMNEEDARSACQYFKECITVAPIATRVSAQ